jgi:hypothetical protein
MVDLYSLISIPKHDSNPTHEKKLSPLFWIVSSLDRVRHAYKII